MRTDYTRPASMPVKKSTTKLKIDKKRLFTVFACAFVLFFLFCTFAAKILTPNIDAPALDNNKEVVPSLTSDDFKGRMDPRLKGIEQQENGTGPVSQTSHNSNAGNIQRANQPGNNNNVVKTDNPANNNANYQESDPVPYKNNNKSDILMPEDLQYQDAGYVLDNPQARKKVSTHKVTSAPASARKPYAAQKHSTPSPNLDLRDKIDEPEAPTPSTDY